MLYSHMFNDSLQIQISRSTICSKKSVEFGVVPFSDKQLLWLETHSVLPKLLLILVITSRKLITIMFPTTLKLVSLMNSQLREHYDSHDMPVKLTWFFKLYDLFIMTCSFLSENVKYICRLYS
mgnify:FL=1